ncbi:MAG: hypothetical protein MPF33_06900 [Candidatus Aramenus sp.]|jgi:hypothetical protein|nr:hypothetical protein [Candidatus Aramenus sp.]
MIKRYSVDNKRVFLILDKDILYADTEIVTRKLKGKSKIDYVNVNVDFKYGKVVRVVVCNGLYSFICNAIAKVEKISDENVEDAYRELLKELSKLA